MTLVQISAAEQALTGSNFPGIALREEIWRDDTGSGVDVVGNDEDVYVKVMLVKRGSSGSGTSSFNANGVCSASAVVNGITRYSSGGLNYDFRSASGRSATGTVQMLWEGWVNVPHGSDGQKTLSYSASWGGDSNLGSQSVSGSVALPRITTVPTTPTAVVATRVSDTEITVGWTQTNPGHGVPTSNTIQRRVNGGAWGDPATVSPTTAVSLPSITNQKLEYQVRASNAAGSSAWSTASAPVFTTPAAPTSVTAAKNASLDVVVAFVDNVAFAEHVHRITPEYSTDAGATWTAATPVDVAAGTTSRTFVAPDPSKLWRYRVVAVNTDTAALASAPVVSNTVQLLAAPQKPTLPPLGPNVARSRDFKLTWAHNPVDTTAQTAFEVGYSTNGGTTWSSSGKTAATGPEYIFPADAYASGVSLTVRVRTWGQAATGGSDGTGASPWSDPATVTFKTAPVATIVSPADGNTWGESHVVVKLGFSQAEGATFVRATITLKHGTTVLETVQSTSLAETTLTTRVADGDSYTIEATVLDSNGVTSDPALADFDVAYTDPVPAGVVITYLEDRGWAQLDLTFPAAGVGQAAAVAFLITRTIAGATETVQPRRAIAETALAVLDTLPTIHGTNSYTVTTISEDGATVDVMVDLVTDERRRAFLSAGPGFADVVSFSARLKIGSTPSRAKSLVSAAGRSRKIALFGQERSYVVSVSVELRDGLGSLPLEVEQFVLDAGVVCHRDPTGRRVFGALGDDTRIDQPNDRESGFSYTVAEVS